MYAILFIGLFLASYVMVVAMLRRHARKERALSEAYAQAVREQYPRTTVHNGRI